MAIRSTGRHPVDNETGTSNTEMGSLTTVTIEGGFNAAYSVNSGSTLILEPAPLAGGTVSFDNVGVRRL